MSKTIKDLVVRMHVDGASDGAIAASAGVSKQTVFRFRKTAEFRDAYLQRTTEITRMRDDIDEETLEISGRAILNCARLVDRFLSDEGIPLESRVVVAVKFYDHFYKNTEIKVLLEAMKDGKPAGDGEENSGEEEKK